jgi:hypothetical protein
MRRSILVVTGASFLALLCVFTLGHLLSEARDQEDLGAVSETEAAGSSVSRPSRRAIDLQEASGRSERSLALRDSEGSSTNEPGFDAVIVGRVVWGSTGLPVARAKVVCTHTKDTARAETDFDGRFRFPVPSGASVVVTVPGSKEKIGGSDVRGSRDLGDIIVNRATCTLAFRFRDEVGAPVAGAHVYLDPFGDSLSPPSDATGLLRHEVSVPQWRVIGGRRGMSSSSMSIREPPLDASIEIVLERRPQLVVSIEGQVPKSGFWVSFSSADGSELLGEMTSARDRLLLPKPPYRYSSGSLSIPIDPSHRKIVVESIAVSEVQVRLETVFGHRIDGALVSLPRAGAALVTLSVRSSTKSVVGTVSYPNGDPIRFPRIQAGVGDSTVLLGGNLSGQFELHGLLVDTTLDVLFEDATHFARREVRVSGELDRIDLLAEEKPVARLTFRHPERGPVSPDEVVINSAIAESAAVGSFPYRTVPGRVSIVRYLWGDLTTIVEVKGDHEIRLDDLVSCVFSFPSVEGAASYLLDIVRLADGAKVIRGVSREDQASGVTISTLPGEHRVSLRVVDEYGSARSIVTDASFQIQADGERVFVR